MPNPNKNFKTNQPDRNLDEQADSLLNLFDFSNPDIDFFNAIDDELIKISGSKIYYYKFYRDTNIDEVYGEARNKTIASEPIIVHGSYDPKVIEETLSEFGIELTNDQNFIFNKTYIEKTLGRLPWAGDVVKPQFQEIKYKIFEVQEDSFEIYGVYHVICSAKILRDSDDVQDMPLDQQSRQDDLGGYDHR